MNHEPNQQTFSPPEIRHDASKTAALQALFTAAVRQHRSGGLSQAEALYKEILKLDPNQPDAVHLLGVVFGGTGRAKRGKKLIADAIEQRPGDPSFHSNLANILRREGQVAPALEHYRKALDLDPDFADGHANMAGALVMAEFYPQAETAAMRALELAPDHPVALANLCGSLIGQCRYAEATEHIDRARQMGVNSSDIWLNSGFLRLANGEFEAAEAAFLMALRLEPDLAEGYRGLGFALVRLRKIGEAKQTIERFISIQGDPSSATAMLGHIEMSYGDFDAGRRMMNTAVKRPGASASEHSTYVFNLNYGTDISQEDIAREHDGWQQRHRSDPLPVRFDIKDRPMRLGFVSPDFKGHSVSFFFRPLMEELIALGVECYCYGNVGKEDPVSETIKNTSSGWRSIWGIADNAAARMIMDDQIDLLVDLAGHTAENRLTLFSLRPAPMQIAYLGYPNTTGLSSMDARIVDFCTDPVSQPWHGTETLGRLDRCFLSYRPDAYPAIEQPPMTMGAPVTFGSFNNLSKVNPAVIELWAQILHAVPNSRLLIKHDVSGDPLVQENFRRIFDHHGIDAARLIFKARASTLDGHLTVYNEVDIALDPFPYNGTTTTCEALWMGVPVVTLLGNSHASRVSASLLSTIGFEAGIAQDPEDYINTAVQLASNPAVLVSMRQILRQSMVDSPLGDPADLARAWLDEVNRLWDEQHNQDRG